MNIRRALALSTLLLAALASSPALGAGPDAVVYHVAPGGSDRNPGTKDQPFATVEAARDALRARTDRSAPASVIVHGGTYRLDRPVVFTPEDSGSAKAPITYRAADGETPVLSGGRPVTGWKEATVNGRTVWVAELPEVRDGKAYYRQLWVNGARRTRARHPNSGFLQIAGLPAATKKTERDRRYEGQDRFQFKAGDLRQYNNLSDVEVVVLHLWVDVHLPVVSVDEKERQVTFSARSLRRLVDNGKPARYYVVNALELLDEPGEWYLDRPTGKLYYAPLPGERLDAVTATVARLPALVRFEGKPEASGRLTTCISAG
ncbi:MAG: hypothetical protein U0736_00650 [Gemmataceae bacterium]